MTQRRALVLVGGSPQETPTGDTLYGGGTAVSSRLAMKAETDFLHAISPQGGFAGTAIGSGTCAADTSGGATGAAIYAAHPGRVAVSSSTTANSGYAWATHAGALTLNGGELFDLHLQTPADFTGTTIRAGLLDTGSSAEATDGAYFELSGSGAIVGKTSVNSTRSSTATIATLSASTWYHLRVTIGSTVLATFDIFDDAGTSQGSATLTANIPATPARATGAGVVLTNSGTTATALGTLDYVSFAKTVTRGATS